MENVRYGTATTTRKNKGPSYERTSAAIVNAAVAAASSRQTPSTGGGYENYHSGRRQWSRRRDVHPSPDDVVRVSTLSPPAAAAQADAVRRRVDSSDVHTAKSSAPFWSPTAASTTGVGQTTAARSQSRPRPQFILEHAAVGRVQMSPGGDYVRDSAANRRVREDQQFTDEYRRQHRGHRQQLQQHQQQQHHAAAGLNLSVEISARCAVDCRPQVGHNSSLLPRPTVTSPLPTPAAPVSPSYLHDNKTLLKEAIISAAAAKLARSSSARSAVVRPLVVVRNGPFKASSDEHVDGSDEAAVPSPLNSDGAASPVTPESCMEHTADVAVAAAAAAAARRSRSRRQDANSSVVAPAPGTSAQNDTETRKTRPVVYGVTAGDQASQSSAAASSVSGTSMQGSAGSPETRTAYNDSSRSTAAQTSTSSNRDRRQLSVISATDTTYGSETLSKTKKTGVNAGNIGKCSQTSASNTPRTDTQRANRTINDSNVNDRTNTSNVGAGESHQESPSSGSKVSFIKSILTRTRSPSPSRRRRSRSRGLQASPSSSSVRRLGAEVAQRISEPVKGYLKQLRDRSSSQRRRPTDEPALAVDNNNTKTGCQPPPPSCQDRELASIVDSQSKSIDTTFSSAGMTADSDDRSTDNMSNSSGQFRTDKKQDSGISVLTPQWKSASELTTPMSRLDDLLKANSLQHLRRTAKAAFQTSGSAAEETDRRAVSSTSVSSALPLHSKTSQSTGCLLASPALNDAQRQQQLATEARQRATTMTRCYLEKPPRATLPEKPPHRIARRAMTVQLDRRPVDRQTPSLSVAERQSTSQADLRHPQPPAGPSALDEESLDSGKSTNDNDVSKQSTDELVTSPASSTSSTSRRLRAADSSCQVPSQTEIDLQDLYEQKRLERQLEEKLARVERERADMIAKLWSQIDNRTATNTTATRQRTAAIVNDGLGDSSASSGLVLPLPHSTTSPSECNRQAVGDALGDLLIELSSTSTATRWTERRRGGRASTSQLRPRAASCSRPLTSNKPAAGGPAAADAAALSSKSLSHNQLHVNPSSSSDLARAHSSPVQLRHKSHQQLEQVSARPLTCYLPVLDRNLDLRRFVETAGHRLDQCELVQLTSSTCHGYLSKLSPGVAVRQWKRRWFVFDRVQRCLHYHADKTEKRADGAFIWFQTIQDVFVDHERRSRSPRPECTFCVKTVDRPLFLMAPTPEAMRIWIDVIFTGAEGYQQFLQQ